MQQLVSILIPFYNVSAYVGRCLDSIARQTYSNIELILVNDSSTDDSLERVESFLASGRVSNYHIVSHETNQGIAVGRNTALSLATGDYVIFIDADDWIEPNMIELMLSRTTEVNADICGCGYTEETGTESIPFPQVYPSDHMEAMRAITVLHLKGVLWKLLVRRSIYTDNNLQFIPGLNVGEDYIMCCKLFYHANTIVGVDAILYHYVRYNTSSISNASLQNILQQAKAVSLVEQFYRAVGIYDDLVHEINVRKFVLKSPLVLKFSPRLCKEWKTLFPESNYLWNKLQYGTREKLLFLWAKMS